ncbi:YcxB family protein [Intestinimonas sp.]|uniref:YcxB family protein n=1 Tax=Intestinimonas sp. TaxID=1965293 RepID=UPI0026278AF6|nr:YcxB family protein [Intestinimonas sp.]
MEPIFQVETAHDTDAYAHMIAAHYILHQKNPIWVLYALAVVLALAIWWIAAAGNYASIRALGTGIFCLAVFLLAVPYVDRSAAKRVCRRMEKQVVKAARKNGAYGKPIRYRFFDDHLDAADSAGSSDTPYDQIVDLVETDGYLLVFLKSGQCILARKKDFTLGDPAALFPFLAQRSGKTPRTFQMPGRGR